jgi:hypothetical protein
VCSSTSVCKASKVDANSAAPLEPVHTLLTFCCARYCAHVVGIGTQAGPLGPMTETEAEVEVALVLSRSIDKLRAALLFDLTSVSLDGYRSDLIRM